MEFPDQRTTNQPLSSEKLQTAFWIGRQKLLAISAVLLLTLISSCAPDSPLITAFRDSDGDGWYDENRNQHIKLFIDSIENNTGSSLNARPAIAIGDRIVTRNNEIGDTTVPVASRTIGTWGIPERTDSFQADLRITQNDIFTSQSVRFSFSSVNSTFTVSHNNYVVHFRTVRTLFADRSPNDAAGDADEDGLTDIEEAKINSPSRSVGNPLEKDLLLVVGFTHPAWDITRKSQDLLTTVFFNKKRINLNIYTVANPALNITPGQIRINGAVPNRNHKIAFAEAELMRPQLLPEELSELFHVLILAEELNDGVWGRADIARPANDLICRSHLPALGADFLEYQAKDIMHELGHNLGLCHPTASVASCPTGAIPLAERNAGLSAMGTPAEAAGPVEVMTEALSRPLDYTPGQWQNLDLRRLRPE